MFVQFVWLLQLIGVATGRRGGSRCHERGCTTRSSFDTAGSRECDVLLQACEARNAQRQQQNMHPSVCSTQASFGTAGSRNVEFCSKHANTIRRNAGTQSASRSRALAWWVAGRSSFVSSICQGGHDQRQEQKISAATHGEPQGGRTSVLVARSKAELCSRHA